MNYQGRAISTGVKTSYEVSLNPNLVKILGLITIGFIIIVVILDVVFYIKRIAWFSPYKAQPTDKTNVYYPYAEPDPETGKAKISSQLPSGVASVLQSNLTQYNSISGSLTQGWGYVPNTNKPS